MPKYSDMEKPTERKRTIKIIARTQGSYELHYMGTYVVCYDLKELMDMLPSKIEIIKEWAEQL